MKNVKVLGLLVFLLKVLEGAAHGAFFPIYVPFLHSFGLDELMINTVNTFFFIGTSILDPFTGNLADRFGRRKMYVFGTLFWVLASFSYAYSGSFLLFIRSELLAAAGKAFQSEALEAWLRPLKGREETHTMLSKANSAGKVMSVVSSIVSGYMASEFGYAWGWKFAGWLFLVCFVISVVMWVLLPSSRNIKVKHINVPIWATFKMLMKNSGSRRILITSTLAVMAVMPFNMFWPLLLVEFGFPSSWLGLVAVLVAIPSAYGLYLSGRRIFFAPTFLGFAQVFLSIGAPMLVVGLFGGKYGFLALFTLHELGRGAFGEVSRTLFSDYVEENLLSTANSIRTGLSTLGGAVGLVLSGYLAKEYSQLLTWHLSAGLLIILAIYLYFTTKEK